MVLLAITNNKLETKTITEVMRDKVRDGGEVKREGKEGRKGRLERAMDGGRERRGDQ
jgi:hypothetical protein